VSSRYEPENPRCLRREYVSKQDISNKLNEVLGTNIRFEKLTNQEINQIVQVLSNPQKLMLDKIKANLTGMFQERLTKNIKGIFDGKIIKEILG